MFRLIATSIALASLATPAAHAQLVDAFPGLSSFDQPIGVVAPGDGSGRLFVLERPGRIHIFDNSPDVSQRTLFLDISATVNAQGEGGLLGMDVHPDFGSNGYFYIACTAESPWRTIVARYTVSAGNPNVANPGSEQILIELPQFALNHKGGCLQFGTDGYLYISVGDDGNSSNSQDLTTIKGKVLRSDVDHPAGGENYSIPGDNPFAGNSNGYREEIWAWGFRNPWRFSFDEATGNLWLADVGQNEWEEVNIVRKGRNYGWPFMEGNECFSPSTCDTAGMNLALPLYVYDHDFGSASVTGGCVYRGPSQSAFWGRYIFADYITGMLATLTWDGTGAPVRETIPFEMNGIVSFGVDDAGELYVARVLDGTIYRFDTATSVDTPPLHAALAVVPNPFGAQTVLELNLERRASMVVDIYDVRGRHVRRLSDETRAAGAHAIPWDGRDDGARAVPAGVYFGRVAVDGRVTAVARMVRLR
jgi:glucose/arabinose dehydrogenase